MQTTEPLQQHIRRARIRYEKIGINIERLLGGLGRDRNDASAPSPYAKYAEQPLVEPRSILDCIAAVVKQRVCAVCLERQKIGRRIRHGAAQPQDALPFRCGSARSRESLLISLDHHIDGATRSFGQSVITTVYGVWRDMAQRSQHRWDDAPDPSELLVPFRPASQTSSGRDRRERDGARSALA